MVTKFISSLLLGITMNITDLNNRDDDSYQHENGGDCSYNCISTHDCCERWRKFCDSLLLKTVSVDQISKQKIKLNDDVIKNKSPQG